MTQTKIWVHVVWAARGRNVLLSDSSRQEFQDHLREFARNKQIEIGIINCWVDHIHCLIRLRSEQSLEDVVKAVRTEAGKWINEHSESVKRINWEKEYFAASVSEGNLQGAKNYILSQERHHSHRTFREEIAAYFSLDFPVKNL